MSRIEDFGEKIQGARKDAHQRWLEQVEAQVEQGREGFLTSTLSKVWPEPNYQRMTLPSPVIDWVRAARDELGPKPSRVYLRSWAQKGNALLTAANALMQREWDENVTPEQVHQIATPLAGEAADLDSMTSYGSRLMLESIEYTHARALSYAKFGHKNSLRFTSFTKYDNPDNEGKSYSGVIKESARSVGRRYMGNNWESLIDAMAADRHIQSLQEEDGKTKARAPRKAKISLISITGKKEAYAAVKLGSDWIKLEEFPTIKEARDAFMDVDRHHKWQDAYEAWRKQSRARVRSNQNAPRQGKDWREGVNVDGAMFTETFGFRGVQFGNYVGNNRRQEDLNNAFDGLMDMAWVLDIPPKSLSLDGTLGLAFGARGRGGINPANAHYESDHKVINLTKTNGAGSLAHEWFHALDNYIASEMSSRDSESRTNFSFLTERLGKYMNFLLRDGSPENKAMATAFKGVTEILKGRSIEMDRRRSGGAYWSEDIEIAARSFESGLKEALSQQGCHNDYLVNIIDEDLWEGMAAIDAPALLAAPNYPYPLKEERAENAALILGLVERMCAESPIFDETFSFKQNEVEQTQQAFEPIEAVSYSQQGQLAF